MYICEYVCVYTYIHIHVYTYVDVHVHVCVCFYTDSTDTCTTGSRYLHAFCRNMYLREYVCMCVYYCIDVCIYHKFIGQGVRFERHALVAGRAGVCFDVKDGPAAQ